MVVTGGHRDLETRARWHAWRAAEILQPCYRNLVDAPSSLPPAPPTNRRVSRVDLRNHGPSPLRSGSHHALTTRAVAGSRSASSSKCNRLHLIVDRTGLSIVGEGEWAAAKHGGRGKRGWKKLHLGVDRSGYIIAHALTEATGDDALTGIDLIEGITGAVASLTADAAYDTIAFYAVAAARGARVVVPPAKTATALGRGPRSRARDRTIRMVADIGRRQWKKAAGYHRQARAENAFFRHKTIFGGALRARSPGGQVAEALLACNVLNQMTELGRPDSYAIGR